MPLSALSSPVSDSVGCAASSASNGSAKLAEHVQLPSGLFLAIAATPDSLIAFGSHGRIAEIALSESLAPNSKTLLAQPSPVDILLTAASVSPSGGGFPLWAVGHDGVILTRALITAPWQLLWQRIDAQYPLTWLDVVALSKTHVLAFGAYGQFAKTNDGGKNWQLSILDSDLEPHLNTATQLEDGRLFVAAEAGVQYWSEDGGANWYADDFFPYDGAMFTAQPWGKSGVLVAGLLGHVFVTDNPVQADSDTKTLLSQRLRLLQSAASDNANSDEDWAEEDDAWSESEDEFEADSAESHWRPINTGTKLSFYASVRLSNGDVLLAGQGGVLVLIDARTEKATIIAQLQQPTVSDLFVHGQQLWVTGDAGVQKYALEFSESRPQSLTTVTPCFRS